MRVLHVITNLDAGGAERSLYSLLAGLDRTEFSTSVLSLMGRGVIGDRIQNLGIPVYTAGLAGISFPSSILKMGRLVRKLQPDLIQGWMYHGNLAATMMSACVPSTPVLWNIRHTPTRISREKALTNVVIRLGALLSRSAATIIYNARRSVSCHEAMGFAPGRKEVIPNAYDLTLYAPRPEARLTIRSELGLGRDSFIVGLIANYRPIKDHETFLDAAAILHRRKPEIRFVLAGLRVQGSNLELTDRITERGLQGAVHLLGAREDIPVLTAALDVASSTSRSEAFPNVLGEAISCGIPCVATDVGDSRWIVGPAGKIVPPRDAAALARAWEEIYLLTREERARLGTVARNRAKQLFSLNRMIERYENLHRKVGKGFH